MATPFVSGVAALVKSANPRLSAKQIKNVILNNVDVILSLVGKVNTSERPNASRSVSAAQRMAQQVRSDRQFVFGSPGVQAVPDDWNGDEKTEAAVFLNGEWWVDNNRDGFGTSNLFLALLDVRQSNLKIKLKKTLCFV